VLGVRRDGVGGEDGEGEEVICTLLSPPSLPPTPNHLTPNTPYETNGCS
jgi:hypothetical protein